MADHPWSARRRHHHRRPWKMCRRRSARRRRRSGRRRPDCMDREACRSRRWGRFVRPAPLDRRIQ